MVFEILFLLNLHYNFAISSLVNDNGSFSVPLSIQFVTNLFFFDFYIIISLFWTTEIFRKWIKPFISSEHGRYIPQVLWYYFFNFLLGLRKSHSGVWLMDLWKHDSMYVTRIPVTKDFNTFRIKSSGIALTRLKIETIQILYAKLAN